MWLAAYIIYVVLSIAIISMIHYRNWKAALLKSVVVSLLPVIGWLMPMFWPKKLMRESKVSFHDYVQLQHVDHQIKKMTLHQKIEREKELNIIPIEEALLVSEHQIRRRVMIDVLKQDSMNYMEILQSAVRNDDTETSHYAVSAVMETKRKLQLALQDLSVKYEQHQQDPYVVVAYAEVLRKFMRSGFLDKRTLLKHQYTYLSILEKILQLSPEHREWAYKEKIDLELQFKLYLQAEESGLNYLEIFPNSEDAYLCLLKVYYTSRSHKKLHQTLERLKQTPIRLSNHALTVVRFWSEGA